MSNSLTNALKAELFKQQSGDPFLTLITLTHPTFTVRLVNNTEDIVSNGFTFTAFPVRIRLPLDDGESARDLAIDFDNASRQLIQNFRGVTDTVGVKIEMILASMPDVVQLSFEDLTLRSLVYTATKVSAKIVMDNFLGIEMTSERYNPTNFPGLF